MSIRDLLKFIFTVWMLGASIALAAFDPVNDDTDIFLTNPNITAERPNVLIILDNTANWNQPFTNEKNALVQVVNSLNDEFNVGLMMFPETGGGNDSIDGGYVRYAVRRMTQQNKTALSSMVNNLHIQNDKGNNATTGLALHEAYLYYAGKTSIASHGKVKTDKDGTTDPLLSPLSDHALPTGTSPALYRSPISDGCARNFIIYISNGPANENASARADLEGKLATLTGTNPPAVIGISPSGQQANWADEMAKFMANADVMATSAGIPNSEGVQNVYTYVVEVDPITTGQGPDMTGLLKSVAANGKGKYFGVSSSASGTAIVDALQAIFNEVQAVNSVFASTTLPVSVNVRGTNLNQVYIGVFRPDSNKSPRWLGNLKMYNLALDSATGTVFLADAANDAPPHDSPPPTGNPAENTTTGFVSTTSPSFWTETSSFWSYRDASQNGPGGASDRPDGDLVEKGGAAQQLRIAFADAEAASAPRKLYTCTTGDVNGTPQDCQPNTGFRLALTPFSTLNDAISPAALQLDTRLVSPLTAFETKQATALTDRIPLVNFSNTELSGVPVASISNAATTRTITSLTTAVPKVVTSLSASAAADATVAISNISKQGSTFRVTLATALPPSFVVNASVTIAGNSAGGYNGLWTISSIDSANSRFTITGPSGNPGTGTSGTATVSGGTVNSTTAIATLPAHGFTDGQEVTIANATPAQFNGTFGITKIDDDHFRYTISSAAGNASGTITASGNTDIAVATTDVPHGFLASTNVNIAGASDPAYNGTKLILSVPSTTTFTYQTSAVVGPNENDTGVTASQGGGATVTVDTSPFAHGFANGSTVFISGSNVPEYNGRFDNIIVLDAFRFEIPVANADTLPINTSPNVHVSSTVFTFFFAYAPNHNLKDGDEVIIEGPAPFAGTYHIYSVFGSDYFFYINAGTTFGNTPITATNYTIRPTGGTNELTGLPGTPPQAYVTVPAHGYSNGQEVFINGANPAGYNGTHTIRICTAGTEIYPFRGGGTDTKDFCSSVLVAGSSPADNFSYPLASAPGVNTSLSVTSSIKTTTARATAVNHGFANGSTVAIAGATPSAFNGNFVINVVDVNNFTYTLPSAQGDATGTIAAGQASGSNLERDLIIRWVRGEDNFEDENSNSSTADIRASVHGDVLHSRPAVVNYNRFAGSDDDVFVFYGGNDGVFHAIKGGYKVPTGDSSGLTPGREAWGFIPQEFFGEFKRMRNNSPVISSNFKKPYFMDGPIGVYTLDGDVPSDGKLGGNNDIVNLYIANRRGGRFLYALDVNDPTEPEFLWKIDTATAGFSELGQTWSQPTVITNLAGLTTPVLVFGAGYDPAIEDLDPAVITSVNNTSATVSGVGPGGVNTSTVGIVNRTMGRGIFVVNALTGALVWSAGPIGSGATKEVADMIYAIPSDLTVVRNESGGAPKRAYVGDTGGNVWRIDFASDPSGPTPNLDLTTVTKLASLADHSTASGRRKFLFPPDVVDQNGFDAVLIGSGDREHPFDTTITNRFYMLKDRGSDLAGPVTGATTCDPTITEGSIANASCTPDPIAGLTDLTSNCLQDASACLPGESQTGVAADLAAGRGWFITLLTGEKVVGNAISIGGTTFFNTNQPSETAGGGTCGSNLGVARQYQVATADATATADLNAVGGLTGADRSFVHAGGGYLPSPVHVVVMLGGKPVEAVISGIQVSTPAGAKLSERLRKFWYKEVDPR